MTLKKHFLSVSLVFCTSVYMVADNASLDHKNTYLSSYLNEISAEMEEKTQILDHILNRKTGSYLDIGTGGDALHFLLKNIPTNLPITIIGSDIDANILQAIPERNPSIKDFMHNESHKTKCLLMRMDATNMVSIAENSLDGINASALTHEIFSYVPTKTGLDQLFSEIARVLKKDGIFIYRDPKWDDNPEQDCLLIIKEDLAKYFVSLFLPRFLDRSFSDIKNYQNCCIKPTIYENKHIRINYFLKGSNYTKKAKLDQFIQTPLHMMDFSRNISIEAPRGLISEIYRHYILFLKNIFITELVDNNFFNRDTCFLMDLSDEARVIFKQFLMNHDIYTEHIDTDLPVFQRIAREKKNLQKFMHNGLHARIINKEAVLKYCSMLHNQGISNNLIFVQDDYVWIDGKIATLLFLGTNKGIFSHIETNHTPLYVLEWLKREGEEFYFYKTTDELITYIGQITYHTLKDTEKDGFLLCPITSEHIKTVSRDLYKSIINSHMSVLDIDGNQQDIIFDKNIIHFQLMSLEKAQMIYAEIKEKNGDRFPMLSKWITHEL